MQLAAGADDRHIFLLGKNVADFKRIGQYRDFQMIRNGFGHHRYRRARIHRHQIARFQRRNRFLRNPFFLLQILDDSLIQRTFRAVFTNHCAAKRAQKLPFFA